MKVDVLQCGEHVPENSQGRFRLRFREAAGDVAHRLVLARLDCLDGGVPNHGLEARPIAYLIFTLVVNKKAGLPTLTKQQIQGLYRGDITNWEQVRGPNLQVHLVSRQSGSGTRQAFEKHVLSAKDDGPTGEQAVTSTDCENLKTGAPAQGSMVRCEQVDTEQVLGKVARTDGAIGYSEAQAVSNREDLNPVTIDGHPASPDKEYPFGETEIRLHLPDTHARLLSGELPGLTTGPGAQIVRSGGNLPCIGPGNPVQCTPAVAH